jgi:quercetin dioxygenase-like cupin family protein
MTTTTGPHRSRHNHLQGLLQRKQFLCATEPAWERRGPRDREMNKGRKAMNRHRTRILTAVAAVGALVGAALLVLPAQATPPKDVMTTIIGVGRFTKIDAKAKTDINPGAPTEFWKAPIKTKKSSDLHVLQNTIAPGGTFGWHSHPGPSLVIVKSGTATFYLANDPSCTPHVVPAGSGFVDQGDDVHVVRNEGSVDLVTVVVSLVPAGFDRRIDEPSPGDCLPNG